MSQNSLKPYPHLVSPGFSTKDRDQTIDRLYDVALDPERYEALLDAWEAAIGPLRASAELHAPNVLTDPMLDAHFERAEEVLDRMRDMPAPAAGPDTADAGGAPPPNLAACLAPFGKLAGFVLDTRGRILALNPAAQDRFGLSLGDGLDQLPIQPEDRPALTAEVARLHRATQDTSGLMRVRNADMTRFVLLRLQRATGQDGASLVVVACSEIGWPRGYSALLRDAFSLTSAEAEVVKALVQCGSVNDIAEARGRSVGTIRAQVKSILAKTETRSQVELVRLALSVMDMADYTPSTPEQPRPVSGGKGLQPLDFQRILTRDGRCLTYVVLGDPRGAPLLYLPQAYGLIRWPASAEAEAARRGWRVMVPVRAGFGQSDPFPKGADCDQVIVEDCLQIMDAEGVRTCPIVSCGDDSYFAIKMACFAPHRVSAIIACAGILPLTRKEQFERMEKWHRFIMASAKYTPHLLPFMVKAGFLLARRIGKQRFARTIFGNSAADIQAFDSAEVYEAMTTGSEVVLSEGTMAHDTFTKALSGGFLTDWSSLVTQLRGQLPITFLNGSDDPQVPRETLEEYQEDYPWIDFVTFEGAGHLVLFAKWPEVFEKIAHAMSKNTDYTQSGI